MSAVTSSPQDPDLVPELVVTDLRQSLHFWRDLLGFTIRYDRPAEGFAYLVSGSAHVMLDQGDLGRTWLTGALEPPSGRGINFQIRVPALAPILARLEAAGWPLFAQPEDQWYATGDTEAGVRQFLVQDPDGFLLRLSESIGRR